jgi:hypothetical protein
MVKRAAATTGTAAATVGVYSAAQLLPDVWATWVMAVLLITFAICITLERLIATALRACDLAERVEALRRARKEGVKMKQRARRAARRVTR